MASNAAETLIGAGVLIVAATFLTYASQSSGFGSNRDSYDLRASFSSVEGVTVGTDVRMSGVKIGSVTSLILNRDSYQADVTMALARDVVIPDDSEAKISSEGLLGGTFVEVAPGGSEFMLAEGDEFQLTQSAVSFLNLLLKFASGGQE